VSSATRSVATTATTDPWPASPFRRVQRHPRPAGPAPQGLMTIAATRATMLLMLLLWPGSGLSAGLAAGVSYVEQKGRSWPTSTTSPGRGALRWRRWPWRRTSRPCRRSAPSTSSPRTSPSAVSRAVARAGQVDLTGYLDRNPLPASLEVSSWIRGTTTRWCSCSRTTAGGGRRGPGPAAGVRADHGDRCLRTGGIVLLVLVGFVVLFIIVNTIRLAVVARRERSRSCGWSAIGRVHPLAVHLRGRVRRTPGGGGPRSPSLRCSGPVSDFMYGFFRVLPIELGSLQSDMVLLVVGRVRGGRPRVVALGAELPDQVGRVTRTDRTPLATPCTLSARRPGSGLRRSEHENTSMTARGPNSIRSTPRRRHARGARRGSGRRARRRARQPPVRPARRLAASRALPAGARGRRRPRRGGAFPVRLHARNADGPPRRARPRPTRRCSRVLGHVGPITRATWCGPEDDLGAPSTG